jgi:methyltransferase
VNANQLTAYFVVARLAELVVARRNLRRLRAAGGVEHGRGHYPVMVALHAAWLGGLWAEGRGAEAAAPQWPWLALLAAAMAARIWTVVALGERWTTRVVVLPGRAPVATGPYRLLRHPNYVAVVAELFAAPWAVGATWTAVVGSALNLALLYGVRIPCEERALADAAAAPERGGGR